MWLLIAYSLVTWSMVTYSLVTNVHGSVNKESKLYMVVTLTFAVLGLLMATEHVYCMT